MKPWLYRITNMTIDNPIFSMKLKCKERIYSGKVNEFMTL